MSRKFDELELRRRPNAADATMVYPRDLLGILSKGTPPPLVPFPQAVDPAVDTFERRWGPVTDPIGDMIREQQYRQPLPPEGTPRTLPYEERYGDPTKVINEFLRSRGVR